MKCIRRMKRKRALVCSLLGGAMLWQASMVVHAEEAAKKDPYSLDQVVVTATKNPESEFETNANISVITSEDIQRNHYRDLTQALTNIPGVTVNNYSNGVGYLESSVLLINGTEKIVVVIDGVRANVNGSTFNVFSSAGFLSMDQIERIEVLKGSASTLYGADAKGGVINIITKKPNENKSTLTVEAGSFSKQKYALSTQGKNKDTSWSFSYQKDKSGDFTAGNGVTVPSYLDADAFSLKLNHKLNEKSSLSFSFNRTYADYRFSNTYSNITQQMSPAQYFGYLEKWDASVTHNFIASDKVKNQLTLFMRRQNTDVTSSSRWMMKLGSWGIQDQLTVQAGKKHLLIGGYDMFEDQIFDYNDTYTTYKDKSITNQAFFFQDEWSFDQYWKLTSGVRYDMHSTYGSHTTPAFTLGYKPTDKTHYYVSYKEFFVVPNQYQLFSPYAPSDPSTLKPETGNTVEFGVNHRLDNTTSAAFHIYSRNSKNVIYYDYANNYKVGNIDSEKSNGWDIQLNKKFSPWLNASVSYSGLYIEPNKANTIENRGRTVPRNKWGLGVTYQRGKWDLGLMGRGIVDKTGTKVNAFPISTYWVWDLAVNYKWTKDATVYLKVNNIGDLFYAEVSNNSNVWYLSPGRIFQLGVQYKF